MASNQRSTPPICLQCKSTDTKLKSQFCSTGCKAFANATTVKNPLIILDTVALKMNSEIQKLADLIWIILSFLLQKLILF